MYVRTRKPPILKFALEASLTGGLIGAWEAAALVYLDAELTTSRAGAFFLVLTGFIFGAAAAWAAALPFAFARRTRPGRFAAGDKADGLIFAAAAAALFYAGYYLNVKILPGKLHPLSLAVDVALVATFWLAVRFLPPLKLGAFRRAVGGAVLFAGAVTAATITAGPSRRLEPPEVTPPPEAANLLVITMDTTRADRLGAFGGPAGLTPNLDKLAAAGKVYPRAYCPMPLTGPSHATLFTGRTPRENDVILNGMPLDEEITTLAEALRARGYRTAAAVGAFPVSSKLGFAQGFEYFDDGFSPAGALTRLTLVRLAGSLGLVNAKARLQRPADEVTARAGAWLADEGRRPFFLWVHYFDPHTPYEPPAAYRDRSDAADPYVRLYDGEVAFMDAQIGLLLATLEDAGAGDNTVVVAVADHGESLGEHDYYYDHGRDVYEACMRVPLIVSAPPGLLAPGDAPAAEPITMASLHDLILASLAPLPGGRAAGGEPASPSSADIYGESLEGDVNSRMVVTRLPDGRLYKLICEARDGGAELYDVEADPAEKYDLAEAQPEITRELRRRLEAHFAAQPPLSRGAPADAETQKKLHSLGYL